MTKKIYFSIAYFLYYKINSSRIVTYGYFEAFNNNQNIFQTQTTESFLIEIGKALIGKKIDGTSNKTSAFFEISNFDFFAGISLTQTKIKNLKKIMMTHSKHLKIKNKNIRIS